MSNHRALEMFGRSGNPAMSDATFREEAPADFRKVSVDIDNQFMTLEGNVNKNGILL